MGSRTGRCVTALRRRAGGPCRCELPCARRWGQGAPAPGQTVAHVSPGKMALPSARRSICRAHARHPRPRPRRIRPAPSLVPALVTACGVVVPLVAPMVLVSETPIDPLQIPRAPLPPAEREGEPSCLSFPRTSGRLRSRSAESGMRTVVVRVGAVVEQAVRSRSKASFAMGRGWRTAGRVSRRRRDRVQAVRLAYRQRRLGSEWKAGELIQTYESRATLAFDLQVSDAAGRFVQSRTYQDDDGRFVWTIFFFFVLRLAPHATASPFFFFLSSTPRMPRDRAAPGRQPRTSTRPAIAETVSPTDRSRNDSRSPLDATARPSPPFPRKPRLQS